MSTLQTKVASQSITLDSVGVKSTRDGLDSYIDLSKIKLTREA